MLAARFELSGPTAEASFASEALALAKDFLHRQHHKKNLLLATTLSKSCSTGLASESSLLWREQIHLQLLRPASQRDRLFENGNPHSHLHRLQQHAEKLPSLKNLSHGDKIRQKTDLTRCTKYPDFTADPTTASRSRVLNHLASLQLSWSYIGSHSSLWRPAAKASATPSGTSNPTARTTLNAL